MTHAIASAPSVRRTVADLDVSQSHINLIIAEAVRQALSNLNIDTRPVTLDLKAAIEYTGLSKTALHNLLREEKITARKEGVKNLFERESLDRYIRSLPAWGSR